MVPINRMVPRSFITNIEAGQSVPVGANTLARGIAFGGDVGVAKVDFSSDGGKSWQAAKLGTDHGKYSFRQWEANFTLAGKGSHSLMARCTNIANVVQPAAANWNTSGFMRNVIEATSVTAV
jgi:hypothetical protein